MTEPTYTLSLALQEWGREHSDETQRGRELSEELDELIARALALGMIAPTIARHAGISKQAVYQRIEKTARESDWTNNETQGEATQHGN